MEKKYLILGFMFLILLTSFLYFVIYNKSSEEIKSNLEQRQLNLLQSNLNSFERLNSENKIFNDINLLDLPSEDLNPDDEISIIIEFDDIPTIPFENALRYKDVLTNNSDNKNKSTDYSLLVANSVLEQENEIKISILI